MTQTERFGRYEVTREEVLEFARKYDPQPFHLDDEAAAKTHFGRLAASGWHTCAMAMRMIVDRMEETGSAGEGALGLEGLRWARPVHPGDVLTCERDVVAVRPSKSLPGTHIRTTEVRVLDQEGRLVMSFKPVELMSEA